MIPAGILVGAGISQQASAQEAAARTSAIATIANMLPVDGCSYPVTINGVDYAPDAAGAQVASEIVPAGGTITARIDYSLTGNTARVECGFGTSRDLPEITFRLRRILESDQPA